MKKSGSVGSALLAGTIVLANAPSAKAVTATLQTDSPAAGVMIFNVTVSVTPPPSTGSIWTHTDCHASLNGSGGTTQYNASYDNDPLIGGDPGSYTAAYRVPSTGLALTGTYSCSITANGYNQAPNGKTSWSTGANPTTQPVQ